MSVANFLWNAYRNNDTPVSVQHSQGPPPKTTQDTGGTKDTQIPCPYILWNNSLLQKHPMAMPEMEAWTP